MGAGYGACDDRGVERIGVRKRVSSHTHIDILHTSVVHITNSIIQLLYT